MEAPPLQRLVLVKFDRGEDYFLAFRTVQEASTEFEPVYIFPLKLIYRLKAFITIQAIVRGFILRKKKLKLFIAPGKLHRGVNWRRVTLENTQYWDFVIVHRAVNKIRQFFIWYKVKQRINTLSAIAEHV